jgi:hypothetical protein
MKILPLQAESSPTPNVVTRACKIIFKKNYLIFHTYVGQLTPMPRMRAYPSAAYDAFSSLQLLPH